MIYSFIQSHFGGHLVVLHICLAFAIINKTRMNTLLRIPPCIMLGFLKVEPLIQRAICILNFDFTKLFSRKGVPIYTPSRSVGE